MERISLIPINFNPNAINPEEDILEILDNIARELDFDFNGENGEDYLWDAAKREGYTNNADYLYDLILKKIKDKAYDKYGNNNTEKFYRLIEEYIDYWMGADGYYQSPTICCNRPGSYTIAYIEDADFYAY